MSSRDLGGGEGEEGEVLDPHGGAEGAWGLLEVVAAVGVAEEGEGEVAGEEEEE